MRKEYDFVLFENQENNINHYKDIVLIADLLLRGGYKVAIADVFEESKYCQIEGVPHISFAYKEEPDRRVLRFWEPAFMLRKWKRNRYYKRIIKDLSKMTSNIYAGSYHLILSKSWLKAFPEDVNCFFWGLRSWWLEYEKYHTLSLQTRNACSLRKFFKDHENLKFFVSEEVIKDEFLQLGFKPNQLVVRPERYIKKMPEPNGRKAKDAFQLLSIGSLRADKRIERLLKALRKTKGVKYIIAGESRNNYENVITESSKGLACVERRNYRISEEEYQQLIHDSDFLILCDKPQKSVVTNGTMQEALLAGTPIIAPSYGLYKYYVDTYGVGVLFDPDDNDSIINAIETARSQGKDIFLSSLKKYQSHFLIDNVAQRFNSELKQAIQYD